MGKSLHRRPLETFLSAEPRGRKTTGAPALRSNAFPDEAVPETYILREGFEEGSLDGAVVRQPLAAGEPITQPKIVRPGDRGFLAAVLKPGMRAVSVPINATTGISGFVFPGDAVDLLLTVELDLGGRERRATQTILSDIRVLAVDQRTNDQEGEPELAKTATAPRNMRLSESKMSGMVNAF